MNKRHLNKRETLRKNGLEEDEDEDYGKYKNNIFFNYNKNNSAKEFHKKNIKIL